MLYNKRIIVGILNIDSSHIQVGGDNHKVEGGPGGLSPYKM